MDVTPIIMIVFTQDRCTSAFFAYSFMVDRGPAFQVNLISDSLISGLTRYLFTDLLTIDLVFARFKGTFTYGADDFFHC